ncbi:unnamed protein product [Orchesella dallaii]|uniref:TIR domain-containing protein n=1 Tax=Orchesella dallaii TaxID=48710 RepID=A0ABP1PYS0_9HEXA
MKYSILVLGASISISLFIRICCALEANALYKYPTSDTGIFHNVENLAGQSMDMLLSGRADEVYEKLLRFSVLSSFSQSRDFNLATANLVVDGWINDMKHRESETYPEGNFRQGSRIASHIKETQGDDFFQQQLCGLDPPLLNYTSCDPGKSECEQPPPILPEGCEYNESLRYMKCSDGDITAIPPLPPQLSILDLNKTTIQTVPKLAFRNVSIKTIRLYENSIEFIHPWAFHDVENLTSLQIVGNQIEYLAFEIYVGLNEALMLDLQDNRISFEIYQNCPRRPVEDIMPVLPKLSSMILTRNPLKIIPEQMFAGLRHSPIRVLYLDNCNIQDIHPDAFVFLTRLATLNLSENPALMPTLAVALKNVSLTLERIYLAKNGLQTFPVDALSRFANKLKVLDLSENYFESISKDVMSQYPNLEELYLEDCNILTIENDAFENLLNLNVLILRNNRLREIPAVFPPSLRSLTLTNNHPTMVRFNKNIFQNLTLLQYLVLSGVQLEKLETATFTGLTRLSHLFLDGCDIRSIEDYALQPMVNLLYLSLRNNTISSLPQEAFNGLQKLESLYLDSNQLTFPYMDEYGNNATATDEGQYAPFQYLSELVTLDLSRNQIQHLSGKLFQNLTNLRHLYISENRNLESWKTRLFPYREDTIFNSSQESYFQFKANDGNIQFLTDAMLQDFLRMSQVDLSNNKFICDEGACRLRDMIKSSSTFRSFNFSPFNFSQNFLNSDFYTCVDTDTQAHYRIMSLEDDICFKAPVQTEKPGNPLGLPESSGTTLLISLTASISVILAVVLVLAYRNRVHLRYFLFVAKFKVMQSPRKAKLSTIESIQYDYDVFVSYHQDDSKFIENFFLPRIEDRENVLNDSFHGHVNEARNHIYTIENVKIEKKKESIGKFKVCLHERDFEPGVAITENIVNSVDKSRKTVIFISKKYLESQWCTFEMNLAYHRLVESRRKSFALVLLEEIPTGLRTKVLNYLMVSKTYLQWPGKDGSDDDISNFWRRLRSFLQLTD